MNKEQADITQRMAYFIDEALDKADYVIDIHANPLPSIPFTGTSSELFQAADLVIDMATHNWLYTNVHSEVLKSGTRTLMVHYPPEVLRRLLPHEDVKR